MTTRTGLRDGEGRSDDRGGDRGGEGGPFRALGIAGAAMVAALVLGACASAGPGELASPASQQELTQRGAEIWSATCYRCHNVRPAGEYAAEDWPVIVDHMRTRAHLTRSEAEAVTAFLQDLSEQIAR